MSNKVKCPSCGSTKVKATTMEWRRELLGYVFLSTIPAQTCEACGETTHNAIDSIPVDLAIAAKLLDAGHVEPAALVWARKALGYPAKVFAGLLGVNAASLSRWENGKQRIDRLALAVIRQMITDAQHHVDTGILRWLTAKPQKLPRTVRLEIELPYGQSKKTSKSLRRGEAARSEVERSNSTWR